jgi:calcineurin-like phosphoesterase family protein
MKVKIGRNQNVFFTSDEHFGHRNIIKFCSRPYESVEEMDEDLINKFNNKVPKDGFTIHGGDFYLGRDKHLVNQRYVNRLNGSHLFLMGSHDKWLDNSKAHELVELMINGQKIVVCHYAMRVWPASHYNSWLLYGHSHGGLPSEGKSFDIGVDNNGYEPVSYDDIKSIMATQPDNFNLIKNRRY